MSLTPKNWNTFQHYKDRKPSWIKLHHSLLDDYAFSCLPTASQALAPRLWLLASEYEGGKITATLEEISYRLRISLSDLTISVKPLVESGFFIDDSDQLAECSQPAMPEREIQEQKEEEKKDSSLRSLADVSHETSKRKPRSVKLPLPDNWQPSPMHYVVAEKLKLPPGSVEGRAEDLRIWAASNDIRKANWDMTFHGFLRRAANEGHSNGSRGSRPLQNDTLSVGRAAERIAAECDQGSVRFPARPSLLPAESQGDLRLLSKG